MAARLITKKSTVAAKVPLATDLEIGELAVNTADAKLYSKHSDGSVVQVGLAVTGTAADSSKLGGTAAAEFYKRSNILGTVSQSAGIPTGAIIEWGSNANGVYVRWVDGTQICWGRKTRNVTVQPGQGTGFSLVPAAGFVGTYEMAPSASLYTGFNATGDTLYTLPLKTSPDGWAFWSQGTLPAAVHFGFSVGASVANSIVEQAMFTGRWY